MSEERLQEIKDSIEFQYTLAKAKGYDNALLFTNEEEELVEEIERLQHNQEVSTKWEIKLTQKNTKLKEENKKLHSIIKEIREYIQDRYDGEVLTHTFDKDNVKELLEILDKVEENK